MIRKITLHGHLASLTDQVIEIDADSVAEALRGLNQFSQFQGETPHLVRVEGVNSDIALYAISDEIIDIHVHPMQGGGGGKFGQILLGVLLVAVAITQPQLLLVGAMDLAPQVFLMGAGLVLGGILQLLVPTPNNSAGEKSHYLGSSVDNVSIGTRIAYVYGTRRIEGQYLSFDIDAVAIAPPQGTSAGSPSQNYFEHDVTSLSVPRAPVNPVFTASTAALGVNPVSSWIG